MSPLGPPLRVSGDNKGIRSLAASVIKWIDLIKIQQATDIAMSMRRVKEAVTEGVTIESEVSQEFEVSGFTMVTSSMIKTKSQLYTTFFNISPTILTCCVLSARDIRPLFPRAICSATDLLLPIYSDSGPFHPSGIGSCLLMHCAFLLAFEASVDADSDIAVVCATPLFFVATFETAVEWIPLGQGGGSRGESGKCDHDDDCEMHDWCLEAALDEVKYS
ncbi:hypothetical protein CC86DRAFT_381743 [Ophiobolus disseminans]|uniref:Uncharacterized protein n=1 Tax=Ophiobolus disseminans TaxID=1469910 RepID=A0A6A7A1Q0_9PLEO|nr:hypothetical protein CC86DRAFT_381743 [Ophiobolus disseminans]